MRVLRLENISDKKPGVDWSGTVPYFREVGVAPCRFCFVVLGNLDDVELLLCTILIHAHLLFNNTFVGKGTVPFLVLLTVH